MLVLFDLMVIIANGQLGQFLSQGFRNIADKDIKIALLHGHDVFDDAGVEPEAVSVHDADDVLYGAYGEIVVMVFDIGVYLFIDELGIVNKDKIALYLILVQYFTDGTFVAACDLDIIEKEAAFSVEKLTVYVIGVIGDKAEPLLVIQIAVVLGIGLLPVYLGFDAGIFAVFE